MASALARVLDAARGITGSGHSEEGTSQAVSSLRVALFGMTASALLSVLFAERCPYLVLLPAVIINCAFLQVHPVHGILFSALEIAWLMSTFEPVRRLFHIPLQYAFLWMYSPIFVIFFRKDKSKHGLLGELFIQYVWDPPLLATIWLVGKTRLGGDRFLFPFCTLIDDRIAMGSLPLPWDVDTLVRDYNIGAVVNMTIEWSGPEEHYERHGVRQLRLPTVDTAAPTLEQVHQGVAFIEDFLANNPDKRVFIHCKGGRGRAAVMAACFYLKEKKGEANPHEVVKELKQKRHVVSTAVAKYTVVQEFHAHVVSTHGKGKGQDKGKGKGGKGKKKDT